MGHTNWKEIKYKDLDKITWTGSNLVEIEDFAIEHGFGFSVGSPIRCTKNHNHDGWDDNDECEESDNILEVYTSDWFDTDRNAPATWTHADIGDTIFANGEVAHYGPATNLHENKRVSNPLLSIRSLVLENAQRVLRTITAPFR